MVPFACHLTRSHISNIACVPSTLRLDSNADWQTEYNRIHLQMQITHTNTVYLSHRERQRESANESAQVEPIGGDVESARQSMEAKERERG